jgi:hypothetical protein
LNLSIAGEDDEAIDRLTEDRAEPISRLAFEGGKENLSMTQQGYAGYRGQVVRGPRLLW